MADYVAGRRYPVRRKFHNERSLRLCEQQFFEQDGRPDGDQDADQVDREQHQSLVRREKGRDQQDVDRQPGAARHERDDQHGHQPVFSAFERARGHDGRNVAAETHQQRNERFAVQSDLVHQLVHDESRPRHVAGVFHQRDEKEQDQDVRQEDDHAPHSADDPVDDQLAQRAFPHDSADEVP